MYKVHMCLYRVFDPEHYTFLRSCTVDGESDILPCFASGYSIALEKYAICELEFTKRDFTKDTSFLKVTAGYYDCDDWCNNNCIESMHCHIMKDDDGKPIGETEYFKKYELRYSNP